ncbi:hypothetical protein [Endozoicomonas sp. ONNA2]|uniref:hypothetical protein n=1 Tax=Endozoicomonas sp. ONNA2 TaxID=2828741 RepID=UPI002147B361|nr:hypothetical protein [Endozoicomonas sp. ONNA2]
MPELGGVNGPNNTQQTPESEQPAKATEAKKSWLTRAVNRVKPKKSLDKAAQQSNGVDNKSLRSYKKTAKKPTPIRLLAGLQRYQAERIQTVLDEARSDLVIKGYTVKEAYSKVHEFAKSCYRHADLHLITEAVDREPWQNSDLKELFESSITRLLGKGYSPKEATEFAKRAMLQGEKNVATVNLLIDGMKDHSRLGLEKCYSENSEWAIATFESKGYSYSEAVYRVADALRRSGDELFDFQEWVKKTPTAQEAKEAKTQFIDDELRPRIIEHLEQKGLSTEEATTAANQLIERSNGDINRMATDAVQLPSKDANPVAGQEKVQGGQALALLGFSKDMANIGGIQPYTPPQPTLKPLKKSLRQRVINKLNEKLTALKNFMLGPPANPTRSAAKKALSAYDIGLPPRKLGVIAGLQIYQTRKIQGIIDRAVEELLIKGYSLDDARQLVCEFARPCDIETDAGLITEAAETYPWQDAEREKVFQESLTILQDKGYTLSESEELAKEALGRGRTLEIVKSLVDEVPHTSRQLYAKNYQWAMRVFINKGYPPEQAEKLIAENLSPVGDTVSEFQLWVEQMPAAPGSKDT